MTDKRLGRPPVQGITEALLQAAERVMTSEGFSGLSVDGLATEIGTTRPTFYRRFPNVAHLAFEVLRSRFGVGTDVDTGSLREDLLQLQREDVAMFSSPLFAKSLPGLLESARIDPKIAAIYQEQFIGPRRANVDRVIASARERGEIRNEVADSDLVCDLLVGPILARATLPHTAALNDTLARETANLVYLYLTRP